MSTTEAVSTLVVQVGFGATAVTVVLLGILQFFLSKWIESRLDASIKLHYDKQLADFQYALRIREQATKIADFFAEWASGEAGDKTKLRRLSMELALILPADLYRTFGKCTTYAKDRSGSSSVLIEIRKHLLKSEPDDLKPEDVVHF
jgi:hypothetical protein